MARVGRIVAVLLATSLAGLGLLAGGVPVGYGVAVVGLLAGVCGHAFALALGRPPLSMALRGVVGGAGAVAIVSGLAVTFGPAAVPVASVGVALLLWRHRRSVRQAAVDTAAADRRMDGSAELRGLSDGELGRAWHRSHVLLGTAGTAAELDRLVAVRRSQLDEIERRDPEVLRRRASCASWVPGDSAPFLNG